MRTSVTVLLVTLMLSTAFAEIPTVTSYQGKVTDASGNPIADDTYTMRFGIYDALSAGTQLWDSGDCAVAVAGGVFSVLLGESPQPAITLDFSQDYWLEVVVGGDTQSPRVRMGSVGYAYMASGLVAGTEVSGSVTSGTAAALTVTNTASTGTTYGIWGESASTAGRGVYGGATATSGAAWGGYFTSASTDGRGVYGRALATSGTTSGVYGTSDSTAGRGVYGGATAASGAAYGGYFTSVSTAGRAVYGWAAATSGTTYGIWGQSNSSDGRGVHGYAAATSGTTYGVYGTAVSPAGFAGYFQGNARVTGNLTVDGTLSGSGMGDITAVIAGTGLTGGAPSGDATLHVAVPLAFTASNANPIISGTNSSATGTSPGVRGTSASTAGRGVYGEATATSGITYGGRFESASTAGYGVYGYASAATGTTWGVYGLSASTEGRGMYGVASATTGYAYGGHFTSPSTDGRGVYGHASAPTGTTYGVLGRSDSPGGYGVYYSNGLAGTGPKSCVVKTSKGPTLMYCQESPENWFEDFGEGQLVNGRAHIELDPLFLETVTIDAANPMKVFVELGGPCEGVYVEKGLAGFDVVELRDGASSVRFDYRVVAKRKGFEDKRLDYCAAAERDSYLFPELREKERREMEEERARHEEERTRMNEERARMERERPEPIRVSEAGR